MLSESTLGTFVLIHVCVKFLPARLGTTHGCVAIVCKCNIFKCWCTKFTCPNLLTEQRCHLKNFSPKWVKFAFSNSSDSSKLAKYMWRLCSEETHTNRNLDRNTVIFQGSKRKHQSFVSSGVTASSIWSYSRQSGGSIAAAAPGEHWPGTSACQQSCDTPAPAAAGNCKPQLY